MNGDGRTDPGTVPGVRDARQAGTTVGTKVRSRRGRAWVLVAPLVVVPGLPYAAGTKLWLVPALAVAAEAVFWVAALLFGREWSRATAAPSTPGTGSAGPARSNVP